MWKKSEGKIVVLPLLFAISPLLHNPLYYLSSSRKQTFSSCFDTELLPLLPAPIPLPGFFSLSSEGEMKDSRPGHYPCENIRSWFLPLNAHVLSIRLSRQSLPQPLCPEHRVPWAQGLCLLSSVHPFQTHISQALIPKAVLLFNYQLNSLPLKPLFTTLNDIFSTTCHSFHSTSKQTRVECPAQTPPWGPSALWKTVLILVL